MRTLQQNATLSECLMFMAPSIVHKDISRGGGPAQAGIAAVSMNRQDYRCICTKITVTRASCIQLPQQDDLLRRALQEEEDLHEQAQLQLQWTNNIKAWLLPYYLNKGFQGCISTASCGALTPSASIWEGISSGGSKRGGPSQAGAAAAAIATQCTGVKFARTTCKRSLG